MFNGIIHTILVVFSMKTSRACTGMLSSENDDFKFLKTAKTIKSRCITCIIYFPKYRNLNTGNFSDAEYIIISNIHSQS